ncbi:MAG: NAD/NADP octopine/nopaline dehydrogenase family protein [Ruminococcus sp.]|nr:NAD/NADP octopine/nopaline dehydrogenase family protein [Ruminococcus sp.]
MKITVIGAGNIGTQFAVSFAAKGHDVTIYASKPERLSSVMSIVDENDNITATAEIVSVTNDMSEAVKDADYVFVTHPAFLLKSTANAMYNHIQKGTRIVVVPGTGGAEFFFKKLIDKGAELFGLQRVPAVARLREYGKSVCVTGARPELHLAGIPAEHLSDTANLLEDVFGVPCAELPNYLCVTLTPSNPILHTTRLRTEFADYKEGVFYPRNVLFYEEWAQESSELLFACDDELQQVCRALNKLNLKDVKSLKEHYESDTPEKLTRKIRSIKSLQGLGSPMIETEDGFIPDFSSRYFTADFPYGLAILVQIAEVAGVEVPYMAETLNWYEDVTGNVSDFRLSDFGINNAEDLYNFYCR